LEPGLVRPTCNGRRDYDEWRRPVDAKARKKINIPFPTREDKTTVRAANRSLADKAKDWSNQNKPLPVLQTIFRLLKTGDEMGEYCLYK